MTHGMMLDLDLEKKDKVKGELHVRLIWDEDIQRKLDMDAKMEAFLEKKEKGKS